MDITALRTAQRQRHADPLAVERRHEPVHRRVTARIELVGIEHDALAGRARRIAQRDQQILLLRRLPLPRQHARADRRDVAIARRAARQQLGNARPDLRPIGQRIEPAARQLILRRRPRDHLRILPILEPSILVDDPDLAIAVGHRPALGRQIRTRRPGRGRRPRSRRRGRRRCRSRRRRLRLWRTGRRRRRTTGGDEQGEPRDTHGPFIPVSDTRNRVRVSRSPQSSRDCRDRPDRRPRISYGPWS